jgi:hypothetical protein
MMTQLPAARNRPLRLMFARVGAFVLTLGIPIVAQADIQGGSRRKSADQPTEPAKDRVKRAIAIPTPKDATAKVLRGTPVEIVLEATTASRQPVEFRLGEMPRHGSVTPPQPAPDSKDKAIVLYTATVGDRALDDEFTFRVKHRDTATSGSATIKIEISDPTPILKMPLQLDFGEVLVGETAVRPLEIQNVGTGPLTMKFDLPAPWRALDEKSVITIEPSEKEVLRVGYAPTTPANDEHQIVFPGVRGAKVLLRAKAAAPFEIRPGWLPLAWQPAEKSRRGIFTLLNRTPSALSFLIESSARLRIKPSGADIDPLASADIEVELPPTDTADFHSPISVVARSCRVEVPIAASATPPWLRVVEAKAAKADDGAWLIPINGNAVSLTVENAGGSVAPLFVKFPGGFDIGGFTAGHDLKPGEVAALGVKAQETRGTPPEGNLILELGEDKLSIALRAHRPGRPTSAESAAANDSLLNADTSAREVPPSTVATEGADEGDLDMPEKEIELRAMMDTVGVFPVGTEFDRSLPEIDAVTLKSLSPSTLVLAWKPVGPDYTYVVFRQEYRPVPGDQVPTRYWVPWEGLEFKKSAKEVSVTLKNLRSGTRHSLRLSVKAPDGRLGQASPPFVASTPSGRPGLWWKILLGILIAAGLGWFGWRKWTERNLADDDE